MEGRIRRIGEHCATGRRGVGQGKPVAQIEYTFWFGPGRPLRTLAAMLIVHVHVHVRPECVEAFQAATLANARASVREPGIARFDVVQQADDATRFVLVEAYRDAAAPAAHKATAHYAAWRDAVAPMMAAPRTSVKFANVFPADAEW
jgi:(4S)-4-hydroxy-5-phosphonooxypentane-2,3-dione isomerase